MFEAKIKGKMYDTKIKKAPSVDKRRIFISILGTVSICSPTNDKAGANRQCPGRARPHFIGVALIFKRVSLNYSGFQF